MQLKENADEVFARVQDEIERVMRVITEKIRGDAKKIVLSNKAYASREMYNNINAVVTREAARIIGVVGTGPNVPYSIFRHEGTRPHFPPVEAIQKWVIQKGLVKSGGKLTRNIKAMRKTAMSGKGSAKTRAAGALDESKAIAFLIARKIAKKGTKGLPFLRMALEQNMSFIEEKIRSIKI